MTDERPKPEFRPEAEKFAAVSRKNFPWRAGIKKLKKRLKIKTGLPI
jgi:hypothetical protein